MPAVVSIDIGILWKKTFNDEVVFIMLSYTCNLKKKVTLRSEETGGGFKLNFTLVGGLQFRIRLTMR